MYLGLDTCSKYLNIALFDDDGMIDDIHQECFKHQSEEILPALRGILNKNNIQVDDIEGIVVTEGPGSYTGIRIAMTLAKVWAKTKNIPLYKIGSLQFIAGIEPDVCVYLDARAHRGYFGIYKCGGAVMPDTIITEEECKEYAKRHPNYSYRGDVDFLGMNDHKGGLCHNFYLLKDHWSKVDPIDTFVAKYLKDSSEYMVKK